MPETTSNPPAEHSEPAPAQGNLSAAASQLSAGARETLAQAGLDRDGPSIATAALVGVGVALVEPEFIPGMLIGAGALLAPKLLPALGGVLRPLVKGVIKAGYSTTMAVREAVAEAQEQVEDIIAEARAEQAGSGAHTAAAPDEHKTDAESVKGPRPKPRNPANR